MGIMPVFFLWRYHRPHSLNLLEIALAALAWQKVIHCDRFRTIPRGHSSNPFIHITVYLHTMKTASNCTVSKWFLVVIIRPTWVKLLQLYMSDIVLFPSGTKNGLNRVGAMTSVKWNARSTMKKTNLSFSYMLSKYLYPPRDLCWI